MQKEGSQRGGACSRLSCYVFLCWHRPNGKCGTTWHRLTDIDNVPHAGTAHKLLTQVARRTKGRTGTKQETDKVPEEEFGKGFQQCDRPPENNFKHHSFPLPTYHLQVIQGNLKKALAMTDKPMKVNSECQQYRKSRTGELQIFLHLDERLFRHWQSGRLCWPASGWRSRWWER